MSTTQGPTWQTVATTVASILMSVALGAGGYFVTQQAAKDSRQDMVLDNVTTKLVDISIALVALKTSQEEQKVQQAKEIALREEHDRREMEDLRRQNGGKPK